MSVGLTPADCWRLESHARQMVVELLDEEAVAQQLGGLTRVDDAQFEADLIERELAMMTSGVDPHRSYFRLAVIRTAREALLLRAQIRRLPTADQAPAQCGR